MNSTLLTPATFFSKNKLIAIPNYYIAQTGEVYRKTAYGFKEIKQNLDKSGYLIVNVKSDELKTKTGFRSLQVHRLVLSTYAPNKYFNDATVDHIDNSKTNNNLDNLMWLSKLDNTAKARNIPVVVRGKQFKSISDACKFFHLNYRAIKRMVTVEE